MALGSILGAAAAGATSFGLNKLFGGDASSSINNLSSAPSIRLNAGGLSTNKKGAVSASAERMGTVSNIARLFPEQAGLLKTLRDRVRPGFGELTNSRVAAVTAARQRAIGNLRDNLQRRRVLGSSFGQDAIARAEAEFGKEEASVRSESFLQELGLTNELIGAEFEARRGEFQTLLDEFNVQANAGLQIATGQMAQLGANMRYQAVLAAQSLAGLGKMFEPMANEVSKGVSSIFSTPATPGFSGVGASPY